MCKVSEYFNGLSDEEYFDWLKETIDDGVHENYDFLLKELHKIKFTYSIEMDENREIDAWTMRMSMTKSDAPTSVLEVLVCLCIRIERDIMGEPGEDDPSKWFWMLLDNLDLTICTDDFFDAAYVKQQVNKWLDRKFSRTGKGGLFPVSINYGDQRKVDIWQQMQYWLNENFRMF